MKITLVPKNVATIGYIFAHIGELEECLSCKLKTVCIDALEPGKNYKVVEIKKKEHMCPIDNAKMVVCMVEEVDPIIIIQREKNLPAMEGLTITIEPIKCDEIFCINYEKCITESNQRGYSKIKVKKELRKIECPLSFDLIEVEVEKQE